MPRRHAPHVHLSCPRQVLHLPSCFPTLPSPYLFNPHSLQSPQSPGAKGRASACTWICPRAQLSRHEPAAVPMVAVPCIPSQPPTFRVSPPCCSLLPGSAGPGQATGSHRTQGLPSHLGQWHGVDPDPLSPPERHGPAPRALRLLSAAAAYGAQHEDEDGGTARGQVQRAETVPGAHQGGMFCSARGRVPATAIPGSQDKKSPAAAHCRSPVLLRRAPKAETTPGGQRSGTGPHSRHPTVSPGGCGGLPAAPRTHHP